jgi:hypothetical protein
LSGKLKSCCNACLEKKRISILPVSKRLAEERAEVARADADANPVVLDVERPAAQRNIIVNKLMALPLFTELPATTSLLVFGTARFGIGAPWPDASKLLWTEAALSFQFRNGYAPAILKSDKTTVTKVDLQNAGWQLQLLYVSDRIKDATGNVNFGEGAIEGRIIRKCEEALGITAEVRDGPEYRASTHSKGRLVNKSAGAAGCHLRDGRWGAVAVLYHTAGWEALGLNLMDGSRVHLTAAQALAARGPTLASSLFPANSPIVLSPLVPTPSPALSPSGDAWRLSGESSAVFYARAVANQRAHAQRMAGSATSGSTSFSAAPALPRSRVLPRVAGQQLLRFARLEQPPPQAQPASLAGGSGDGSGDGDVYGGTTDEDEDDAVQARQKRFWPPQQALRMPSPSFAGGGGGSAGGFTGRADNDDDDDGGGDGGGMLSGMPPPFAGYPGFHLCMGGSGGGGSGGGGSGSGGGGSGGMPPPLPPPPSRPLCWYGAACYQKSPWHKAQFQHPAAPDATAASARATTPPPRGAISEPPRSASPVQGGGKKARAR